MNTEFDKISETNRKLLGRIQELVDIEEACMGLRERAERSEAALRECVDIASSESPEGHSPYDTINKMARTARKALRHPAPSDTSETEG